MGIKFFKRISIVTCVVWVLALCYAAWILYPEYLIRRTRKQARRYVRELYDVMGGFYRENGRAPASMTELNRPDLLNFNGRLVRYDPKDRVASVCMGIEPPSRLYRATFGLLGHRSTGIAISEFYSMWHPIPVKPVSTNFVELELPSKTRPQAGK